MKAILKSIEILNFEGIDFYSCKFNKSMNEFRADNGIGKTSIAKAIGWLFHGCDLWGNPLNPKKTDRQKMFLKGLNPHVACVYEIDGKDVLFAKTQTEKLSNHKIAEDKRIVGFSHTYAINGEEIKTEKDFIESVECFFKIEAFKLLSNPYYFNSDKFTWEKRRATLSRLVTFSDSDVLSLMDKSKADFINSLSNIDSEYERLKKESKTLLKSLDTLSAQISENIKTMPDDIAENVEAELENLKNKLSELDKSASGSAEALHNAEINKKILGLLQKKTELIGSLQKKNSDEISKARSEKDLAYDFYKASSEKLIDTAILVKQTQQEIENYEAQIATHNNIRAKLKEEVNEMNKRDDVSCPITCAICPSSDSIIEFRKQNNAKRYEEIKSIALNARTLIADFTEKLESCKKKKESLESEIPMINAETEVFNEKYYAVTIPDLITDFSRTKEVSEIDLQIEALKADISNAETTDDSAREMLVSSINETEELVRHKKNRAEKLARIEELKKEQQKTALKSDETEKNILIIEEFNTLKYDVFEKKINSLFKYAEFSMFDNKHNGSVVNTCKTFVNGVAYDQHLNKGARINAGIEIVKVLSKHFDMYFPFIVDDRESLTTALSMPDHQQIHFFKDENFKTLTKTI